MAEADDEDDNLTWWGGEKEPASVADAAERAGQSPLDAAQTQQIFDALGAMSELDRRVRTGELAPGGEPAAKSVAEAAQRAGSSPSEAAEVQRVFDSLRPMAELDRQRRTEAASGDATATLDDPREGALSKLDGGSLEDRSPKDLDPGFTLPTDLDSPDPVEMDRGFTPTPRTQLTFDEDEGATITAGSSESAMSDVGFSDVGFSHDEGATITAEESDAGMSESGFSESDFSESSLSDEGFAESDSEGSVDDAGFFEE